MRQILSAAVVLLASAGSAGAQRPLPQPAYVIGAAEALTAPVVGYTLRVREADLSRFDVELRIRGASDTIRLAMAAHPEYDDRFWRYVDGVRAEVPNGAAVVAREDSALWRVVAPGGEVVVRYAIRLPAAEAGQRASWRPFLAPTGGLVGGPHAFMYVLGGTRAPAHVTLDLPAGWQAATGLEPTSDPHTFHAPNADVLIDSPVLVGRLRSWRFAVDGVPHRVAYWPLPDAAPFDTTAFVGGIERLARQTIALFGRAPYREYTFLFQDGAYGGLEHVNSVTLGAPSTSLARDPASHLEETAHEFVHTWNLVRIRPAERGGLDYRTNGRSRGLWFSEGLTIFYADLLRRRASLPTEDSTRVKHLESLLGQYLANDGNVDIAPERASFAEYGGTPGSLGDYDPSVHTQGEVLGTMLDLVVRDATAGRRSMDDVMRVMLARFSGERGFIGRDVEAAIAEVCGCGVRAFFDAHVRGASRLDFDRYLRLAGMRALVTRKPALARDGTPRVDLRFHGWEPAGERGVRVIVTSPRSAWARAGLHTGDRLVSMNGAPVNTWREMRQVLAPLRVGDTVRVEVERPTGRWSTTVRAAGFDVPSVRIEMLRDATPQQRALRERWMAGR